MSILYNNKTKKGVVMKDLKAIIKQCFNDMYVVARFYAKKDFVKNVKQGKKYDIARALVFLKDVAENPDKHFSFENTNAAWDKRVDDYIAKSTSIEQDIAENGIDYVRRDIKGSSVASPCSIVVDKIRPLFQSTELWSFCENVQDFYYQKYYKRIYVNDREIIDFARKMSESVKILKQKNPVKRSVQWFLQSNRIR